MSVRPVDQLLQLAVDVPGANDLVLLLEHLAPGLRIGQSAPAPAVFDDQQPGFVSVTGVRSSVPEWCTAWVRLPPPAED